MFLRLVPDSSLIETLTQELGDHVKKTDSNELVVSDPDDDILILIRSC
jgi:hypothetical protein